MGLSGAAGVAKNRESSVWERSNSLRAVTGKFAKSNREYQAQIGDRDGSVPSRVVDHVISGCIRTGRRCTILPLGSAWLNCLARRFQGNGDRSAGRGDRAVDLGKIRSVPLMTIEGEEDDITGIGQCRAALDLCSSIPEAMKLHYECAGVGHYGIFNGSRFRLDIAPRITQFVRMHDRRATFIQKVSTRTSKVSSPPSGGWSSCLIARGF